MRGVLMGLALLVALVVPVWADTLYVDETDANCSGVKPILS